MSRTAFCTILSSGFVSRGLVMLQSLREVLPEAELTVLCMDSRTRPVLERLGLAGLETVSLAELEVYEPRLHGVKSERTLAELCWTAKPTLCHYLLDRQPTTETLVYVDADTMFFASPALLLDELGDGFALIVPHRSLSDHGWEQTHGIYNAGFLVFRRDSRTTETLRWWGERCLEWCFDRVELGRFCDQKYLDDWPERFPGVHPLRHPGAGLAPWNAENHRLTAEREGVHVDGVPLVFYHFQSLRLYRGFVAQLRRLGLLPARYHRVPDLGALAWSVYSSYEVSSDAERLVYIPYVRRLAAAADRLAALSDRVDRTFAELGTGQTIREIARAVVPGAARSALRRAQSVLRRGRDRSLTRVVAATRDEPPEQDP